MLAEIDYLLYLLLPIQKHLRHWLPVQFLHLCLFLVVYNPVKDKTVVLCFLYVLVRNSYK